MKIMISQPMSGKTDEQIYEERKDLIRYLESKGHEVVNTIFTEEPPQNADRRIWYLAKSIEVMSQVDAMYFMTGWENARGCIVEHLVAERYGKTILEG